MAIKVPTAQELRDELGVSGQHLFSAPKWDASVDDHAASPLSEKAGEAPWSSGRDVVVADD
jgi:hypothetical protein